MDVLVAGGTGFVGTALCAELDRRGHAVTALSRSPETVELPSGVETVAADATDYEAVLPHVEGRDAVVNLIALSPLFTPPDGLTHHGVHVGATEATVEAAETAGVDRYLQLSAIGADPDGDTEYSRAKGLAEQIVRESALDWTIVRPSIVFGEGGEFIPFLKRVTPGPIKALPGGGTTQFQPIWVGDLAAILVDALTADHHVGSIYELGGPAVYTLADITRLAYAAEGRSVTIAAVPMGLTRLGLTLADPVPGIPMGTDQAAALGEDNIADDNDIAAFDRTAEDLRTLEDYLDITS